MQISLQDVSFDYMQSTPFSRQALHNIHMEITQGTFVAIVGPTGSGKTTLAQIMSGLLKPTFGTVRVGSNTVNNQSNSASALLKNVGFVFQYPENQLFEDTVENEIAFGLKSKGFSVQDIDQKVNQALEWVGLPRDVRTISPFLLSGGMKRRVAIASILAMGRDILILDEPTAGLDSEGRRNLLHLINQLHIKREMTVILITHQMNEVVRYAQECFVMFEGRCVFQGPPKKLFIDKRLNDWNLDVPEVTKLTKMINLSCKVRLDEGIIGVDELEEGLLRLSGTELE